MANRHDIVFYHAPQSRALIVHWMLEELHQPYDVNLVNLKEGEQRQPAYLAINRMGKVPALSHNGVVITEAAAICCYLADAFSRRKPGGTARRPASRPIPHVAILWA